MTVDELRKVKGFDDYKNDTWALERMLNESVPVFVSSIATRTLHPITSSGLTIRDLSLDELLECQQIFDAFAKEVRIRKASYAWEND
jgi:hypothetical protein